MTEFHSQISRRADELQNRIHGNSGVTSITEAAKFFKFVKHHTYKNSSNAVGKRLLDFGSGWGRVIRPFMRDFEFKNLYGFEPNFLYCSLARTLNPYVTFLSGSFVPSGDIPERFFNLMIGWSIFSHLSLSSATLWLTEAAHVVVPGGMCVFTTWGSRFLTRLQKEAAEQEAGRQIHWYSSVVLAAAGSIEKRIEEYERGEFVWFTGGQVDALRRGVRQRMCPQASHHSTIAAVLGGLIRLDRPGSGCLCSAATVTCPRTFRLGYRHPTAFVAASRSPDRSDRNFLAVRVRRLYSIGVGCDASQVPYNGPGSQAFFDFGALSIGDGTLEDYHLIRFCD